MPDVIGGNPHRGLQRRKARRDSWTMAKRARFLSALESTCNVRMACEAAGVSKDAAYGLRHRDAVFAAAWTRALELGGEELRAVMLSRALGTADADLVADNPTAAALGPPAPSPPMSDEMRLKVYQICRATIEGRQNRGRRGVDAQQADRTAEDAFASIAAKLDRMERKLKRDAAAG